MKLSFVQGAILGGALIQSAYALQEDPTPYPLYSGTALSCSALGPDGTDCCAYQGWNSMDECNAQEKELAEARAVGAAEYIGNLCVEKEGACVSSSSVYCVFKEGDQWDKGAYLIQTTVRKYLNMGFGTASQPDCKGLSKHQLTVGLLMFISSGMTRDQAEQAWAEESNS